VHLAQLRLNAQGELTGAVVCSTVNVFTQRMAVKTTFSAGIFAATLVETARIGIFESDQRL
jgi:hypothetical protein